MKKALALLLALTLLTSSLIQPIGVSAYVDFEYDAVDIQVALEEERELTEDEFYAFIGLMEEYISFEEGKIIIEGEFETLSHMLGEESIEYMVEGIEYLNELADEEELVITENGTIYETSNDEFTLQSGGRNRTTWHWWGTRNYMNTSRANSAATRFRNASTVATATGAISAFFGFAPGRAVSTVLSHYWRGLGDTIAARNANHSRGVRVNFTWVFVYTVARQ